MDNVTPSVRSDIMSRIRSKGNRSTERRLRALLAGNRIKGWRANAKDITGTPDVVFDVKRLAIFVDGCFWHGCPKCYRRPKSKRKFWDAKVVENRARDRRVTHKLRKDDWTVIRLYECELQSKRQDLLNTIKISAFQGKCGKAGNMCSTKSQKQAH